MDEGGGVSREASSSPHDDVIGLTPEATSTVGQSSYLLPVGPERPSCGEEVLKMCMERGLC